MARERRLFPTQEPTEEVRLLLRKHWFRYLPAVIIAVMMLIPLIILIYYYYSLYHEIDPLYGAIMIIGGTSYALFIMALMLFMFVDYYLDINIVTDRRIVDIRQDGFFHRTISELSLDEVQDVSAAVNGPFATAMHYGDVLIQTAGTLPNFTFFSVPHPYQVSKEIMDLHDQRERRLKKVGTGKLINPSGEDVEIIIAPDQEKAREILSGIERDKSREGRSRTVSYFDYSKINKGTEVKEGESVDIK